MKPLIPRKTLRTVNDVDAEMRTACEARAAALIIAMAATAEYMSCQLRLAVLLDERNTISRPTQGETRCS